MRFCDRVSQHLRRAGVVLKGKKWIVTEAAGTPEAEAVFADKRGHVILVEQSRIGCRVLQIPEHIGGNAGDAVHANVRKGFVPAGLFVNFGTQAKRTGGGVGRRICIHHGVKVDEVRPDQHPLSLAEIVTVGNRFFHRFAAVGGQVGEPTQTLRHAQQLSSNRLRVVSRHAEDARLDAQLRLR